MSESTNATQEVLLNRDGAVGELVLNRPERRNAINGPVVEQLRAGLAAFVADDAVRAILLTGGGGVFCSGLDLKDMNADPAPGWRPGFQGNWAALHADLYRCPKPLVAAVEGYAINAGAALALACDFMLVGEDAFVQVGEVRQGVAAPMNLVWLTLKAPRSVVNEVVLLGRRIPGPELVALGLARRAIAPGLVRSAAKELLDDLAGLPPRGVEATKAALRWLDGRTLDPDVFLEVRRALPAAGRGEPLPSLKQT